MKQVLSLFAAALCSATSFAQMSGVVTYEQTVNLGDAHLDNLPAELRAMIPKEHKEQKVLYFTPDKSLYENAPAPKKNAEAEDLQSASGGGIRMQIRQDVPDQKTYTDIRNKKTVQQKALMDRMFLITEETKPAKWKMTGNQKKVLDHAVMEAVMTTGEDTVSAWFTTDIPVPAGPEELAGLPGLILEAHIGKNMVIKATGIKADEAAAAKIKEPTKGKKVSSAEYAKISKEKEEEMRRQFGGSGNVIIKTVTN